MYITFDPRTHAPIGATPVKPEHEHFIEIEKAEWTKFLLDPSLFRQYEAVLQSDGTYTLCKKAEKSFSLKNRFFVVGKVITETPEEDVVISFHTNKITLNIPEDVEKHFTGMTFFNCADGDPDKLYETTEFVGGKREKESDILERIDFDRLSIFGSFKYDELLYGYRVDD